MNSFGHLEDEFAAPTHQRWTLFLRGPHSGRRAPGCTVKGGAGQLSESKHELKRMHHVVKDIMIVCTVYFSFL